MIGILFAVLAAIFIGSAQITLNRSYKELKPSVAFFFDSIFGLCLWVPLAVLMGVNAGINIQEVIFFAVISALLSEVLFFYALSHGEVAITGTIIATYPVYTVILSIFINDESLTLSLAAFVLLTIIGSMWVSAPKKLNAKSLRLKSHIVWPFLAALGIGFSDALSKGYINRSDDFSFLLMLALVQFPIAIAYLRVEKQGLVASVKTTLSHISFYKLSLLGGLFNIVGTGFLWLSFSFAPASIASPITGASGAVTVLLTYALFKEKLTIQKYLAIAITFIGIIGISILNA